MSVYVGMEIVHEDGAKGRVIQLNVGGIPKWFQVEWDDGITTTEHTESTGWTEVAPELIEPKNLTEPTMAEYEDAYRRLQRGSGNSEQNTRDIHTCQWYWWNKGYSKSTERYAR